MIDFFKQVFEAAGSRIRSPILGMVALSFLAINWQPLFFLFFADVSVEERLNYFDSSTSLDSLIYTPGLVGIVVALGLPWLNYGAAVMVRIPIRLTRFMQEEESQKKRILNLRLSAEEERAKGELEEAEERRTIEAARRLEEASEISTELEGEIKKDRRKVTELGGDETDEYRTSGLDPDDWSVLRFATKHANGVFSKRGNELLSRDGEEIRSIMPIGEGHRGEKQLEDALHFLEQEGLIVRLSFGDKNYEATRLGYEKFDEFEEASMPFGLSEIYDFRRMEK